MMSVKHTYVMADKYTIIVSNDITRFNLKYSKDRAKLKEIKQWGTAKWSSMENAFQSAKNMQMTATDMPDLSAVTSFSSMFRNTAFTGSSSIGGWDVSNVTDMSDMFSNSKDFNQNIGGWDVSNVTDMSDMFSNSSVFNRDIGNWDVSSVTNMAHMFDDASAFNQDIGGWDVSSVTSTAGNANTGHASMFAGATAFSQNLGRWYVIGMQNADYDGSTNRVVLNIAAQNTPLNDQTRNYELATGEGDMDNVKFSFTDVGKLSINADEVADGNYSVRVKVTGTDFGTDNVAVVKVRIISKNILVASRDNFITTWRVKAAAAPLTITFPGVGRYMIDWGDGNAQSANDGEDHTYTAAKDYEITVSNTITHFNLNNERNNENLIDIKQWGTANWRTMENAFHGAVSLQKITAPDAPNLSGVINSNGINMDRMFAFTKFNQDFNNWDVSNVRTMKNMFEGADRFNGDISNWDVGEVTDMGSMFKGARPLIET